MFISLQCCIALSSFEAFSSWSGTGKRILGGRTIVSYWTCFFWRLAQLGRYFWSGIRTKTELIIYITTFGVGTACITSAFSFLLLIVLESTRISLAPSKFQNRTFLLGVLTVNVLYVVVSDLIVAHFQEAMVMILICQITFALWGFLIALGYAFAAVRLWRNLRASRQTAQYDPGLAAEGKKITRLVSLLYSASICGVVLFSTIVYTALGETGVYNESGEVSNWPWFAVQTLLRTCEVFMCLIIFLIALKTSTAHSTNNNRVDSVSKVTT